MAQYPTAALIAKNPNGRQTLLQTDNLGGLLTSNSTSTALNLTVPTVVKATPGRVLRCIVIVAGTSAGSVNDTATVAGVAVANQIASIPTTVGTITLEFPCLAGITISPGAGQMVAVAFL